MMRPPPRFTEGHKASESVRQCRAIASRLASGSASIFSSGIDAGATAAGGGGSIACFFVGFGATALGGGAAICFGAGAVCGGGEATVAGGGGGGAAGGGAVLAAGGGGDAAAAGGAIAFTALAQAGDSLAMCWRTQSSASLPPRGTPEQFDKKSERQDERIALSCSSLGFCAWAGGPRQIVAAAIDAATKPHFESKM